MTILYGDPPNGFDKLPSMMSMPTLKKDNSTVEFNYDALPYGYITAKSTLIGFTPAIQLINLFLVDSFLFGDTTIDIDESQIESFIKWSSNIQQIRQWVKYKTSLPQVLSYGLTHGIPYSSNKLNRAVPKWGWIDYTDINVLKNTLEYIGPIYGNVVLYNHDKDWMNDSYDQNITINTTMYDVSSGLWGYSTCLILGYDGVGNSDSVTILLWNKIYKVTWRWIYVRLCEAYGVVFEQYSSDMIDTLGDEWISFTDEITEFTLNGLPF